LLSDHGCSRGCAADTSVAKNFLRLELGLVVMVEPSLSRQKRKIRSRWRKIHARIARRIYRNELTGTDNSITELFIPAVDMALEEVALRIERSARRILIARDQDTHHVAKCGNMILRFVTSPLRSNPSS